MRTLLKLTAAVLAAVLVFLLVTLPDSPSTAAGSIDSGLAARTIPGAYHVHSTVSDGAGTRDEIAAAASAAGLQFVVFTDHGNGTRALDPPRYVHGVLCIDGVEISTRGGHYVALDMRRPEYPLGGEAAAVVEDVRRLGGFGIAAHPDSEKDDLDWADWSIPVDGLEWLNGDSEWRDESAIRLARLPLDFLIRPAAAVASVLDRPSSTFARWDELLTRGPSVGLAAHDAHGAIASRAEGETRPLVKGFPSYEAGFRAFAIRAIAETPFSGRAPDDARLVLEAIRRGRIFTAIDAVAAPALLDLSATAGSTQAQMGDSVPFHSGVEVTARSTVPDGAVLKLICNGREVQQSPSGHVTFRPDGPSACRAEVSAPRAPGSPPVPWLVGNAIQLISPAPPVVGPEPPFESRMAVASGWTIEKDPESQGNVAPAAGAVRVDYRLRSGARVSQYVAAVAPLGQPLPPFDRIAFTGSSGAPMRVSVQLRFASGERWARSVYVEPDARRIVFPTTEMVRAGEGESARPDFRQATGILFVIDLVNAVPGASGWVRLSDVTLGSDPGR